MAGTKGCNDDFAAFVIIILNAILLIMSILGLVGISYVWVMQSDLKGGGEQALTVAIPEFILVLGIVMSACVMAISILGIVATCLQMKENKEGGGKNCAKVGSKDWCFSCGMTIYICLSVIAFLCLLSVAIVTGVYSDKMTQFNSLDNVRDEGDAWIDKFETKLEDQVLKLAKKYPKTWNSTQASIGCCGWSIQSNGNVSAFTNSKCCQDVTITSSVNIIGKVNFDYSGCRDDSSGKVYTCQGVIASYIQGNLVKTSISTAALAFLQLALAICGCVVRYPKLFPCCNCPKKTNPNAVEPTETEIRSFNSAENEAPKSGNI